MTSAEVERLETVRANLLSEWACHGAVTVAAIRDWELVQFATTFGEFADRAYRVGWDIDLKKSSLDEIERETAILNAPLYTSERHPWPRNAAGLYLLPIVQLDLAELSALSGVDLGTGLAQLWQDEITMVPRLVPTGDISREVVTDIPEFLRGVNLEELHYSLGDHGMPYFLTRPYKVNGFSGPYLFGPFSYDDDLKRLSELRTQPSSLRDAFRAFRREIAKGRRRYNQVNRVMGSFEPIADQILDHPPTLFSSDDDNKLNTGDAGNITMHYDASGSSITLSGHFDCC